ncbi:MAG: DUF3137 domain-containing protein [Bacteroidales bacterium]|jgi:hypothetical protein|nr:DUF3137 domain-containing protein [Bacteroidales bacterium]
MITFEELKTLYENQLKERLLELESLRKQVLKYIFYAILAIVPAAAILIILYANEVIDEVWIIVGLIGVLIGGLVFIVNSITHFRKYRERYKKEVVNEIVHSIDPTWNYNYQQSIQLNEYLQSNLFETGVDRYKGDDLITGQIEKTDFRCSEFHTEYKTVTYTKNGGVQEHWHTIFKGLFFHADFNKHIQGETYIAPDFAEKLFGKWGQKFQYSPKGELIKLENPEFEKIFVVHATDQIEARYILTPVMMEALVNIYKLYKRPMHLSFVGSRVYCAISFNENLFEPNIFKSGANFDDIAMIYRLFMLNAVIIKEMNLNTRIWTKE